MFHDPYKLDYNLSRTGNLAPIPVLTYIQGATDISIAGFKKQLIKLDSNIDTLNRDEKASLFNSNNFFEPNINQNSIWNLDMRLGAKLQKITESNQLSWD